MAYLVVNSVKLGEDDAVNEPGLGALGVVGQGLVELVELVHTLVTHQGLPHKQHQVWLVDLDQLNSDKQMKQ